jgi:acyl-coenzyme A thioesterase PaaI-like protein
MGLVGGVNDDGNVTGQVTFGAQHAGAPGVVHGGHLAVVLDEALSHALVSRGTLSVTAVLEVTYRRPALVGDTMDVTAEVEGFDGDRWVVVGRITSRRTGEDVAIARARFAARDASHWERTAGDHDRLMGTVDPP